MSECKYNLAWIGFCKETADESGFCEKHKGIKCVGCGEQSTRECPETMSLVCGAPICDNCHHTYGEKRHDKKNNH